ncbi:hypothetical protein F7734_00045 [Scytonema sp. UIC 10036]|uniref:type II toxin-antitoxin system VapC family toxin n=1 Tax=Scytonema sp. UIC 10036 TaxID=2304196 RepID=UPI0012DA3870|nr:type II toxin-antitoxin system VapC family toxin [Scytonema sp. UIC 10036]MUG90985.1 hypothetical protein [Scytonema sp. UIC 10036]
MYLLDTNHCTFLIEGELKVVNHVRELGKVTLATSAVVAGELRFMAQNSQQKTANLIRIRAFLNRIYIYCLSYNALLIKYWVSFLNPTYLLRFVYQFNDMLGFVPQPNLRLN